MRHLLQLQHDQLLFRALAAVAVTSTAFAQNVTISGRIDAGTISSKTTGSKANTTAKTDDLVGYNTKTTSRITFAGTEDLGGGLTAFFNAESGLNGGTLGMRNLFVGTRGSFGSVQAGRYLNSYSAVRDSHYSIGGGAAGGQFVNRVVSLTSTNAQYGMTTSNFLQKTYTIKGDVATTTSAAYLATPFFALTTAAGTEYQQVFATTTAGTSHAYFTSAGVAIGSASGTPITIAEITTLNASNRAKNVELQNSLNSLLATLNQRADAALSYTTPSFNGFNLTVGISNSKIVSDDPAKTGSNQAKTSGQSYSLGYAQGPLSARFTIGSSKATLEGEQVTVSATAGASAGTGVTSGKRDENALVVNYNFGVVQTQLMHSRTNAKVTQLAGHAVNIVRKSDATEIGIKMPLGAFEPFLTVSEGKVTVTNAGAQQRNVKASGHQLGLNYNLSKRTQVYASTGQHKFKDSDNTSKTTGYSIGLVHNF